MDAVPELGQDGGEAESKEKQRTSKLKEEERFQRRHARSRAGRTADPEPRSISKREDTLSSPTRVLTYLRFKGKQNEEKKNNKL